MEISLSLPISPQLGLITSRCRGRPHAYEHGPVLKGSMINKWLRNSNTLIGLTLLVAAGALCFVAFRSTRGAETQQIGINEVAAGIKDGSVRRLLVSDDRLQVEYLDNRKASSRTDPD